MCRLSASYYIYHLRGGTWFLNLAKFGLFLLISLHSEKNELGVTSSDLLSLVILENLFSHILILLPPPPRPQTGAFNYSFKMNS